ncbi:MAG TPA: hypothetical protein VMH81_16905 [Bryobacteraceae bacterium]|nr:hypothetical protein [Bryobacteraceae bacterium]
MSSATREAGTQTGAMVLVKPLGEQGAGYIYPIPQAQIDRVFDGLPASTGLAYGATFSGPIGVILDSTFDISRYSELPFHSTLCGSCLGVCPVKIEISDQIFPWRRVVTANGYLPLTKRVSFSVADHAFGQPEEYHAAEKVAGPAMKYTPHSLLYSRMLNPWGRDQEFPPVAQQSFRDWYLFNRSEHANT